MKVLFSGHHNPYFPTITEYTEKAIPLLGHTLIVFEDQQHLLPGRIRKRLPVLNRFDQIVLNKKLSSLSMAAGPDIIIVQGGNSVMPETITALKNRGMKCVLWTTDAPLQFQSIIETAPHYDHIFCQGTEAIELLNHAGIKGSRWLPMACDPDYHHRVDCTLEEVNTYGSDIAFVGSYYPNRAALFEALADFDLAIWGPGWEALPAASPIHKHLKGRHTQPGEWLKIYSASKIVLSAHYQDPQNRFPVYQASPRVFEILACGAFQLCDNQRDVFALFKDGRDLVKFSDAKDLVAKVHYYLARPEERQAIAEQGRKTVLAGHTYLDRIKQLLSKIGYES